MLSAVQKYRAFEQLCWNCPLSVPRGNDQKILVSEIAQFDVEPGKYPTSCRVLLINLADCAPNVWFMAADSKCLCPSSSMFSTTMCGAMLASVLVTSTVAIAPPPARPPLLRTFGALMRARSWAPGAQNLSVVGNVAVSESASALYQESHLLDGRTAAQVSKCGPAHNVTPPRSRDLPNVR